MLCIVKDLRSRFFAREGLRMTTILFFSGLLEPLSFVKPRYCLKLQLKLLDTGLMFCYFSRIFKQDKQLGKNSLASSLQEVTLDEKRYRDESFE